MTWTVTFAADNQGGLVYYLAAPSSEPAYTLDTIVAGGDANSVCEGTVLQNNVEDNELQISCILQPAETYTIYTAVDIDGTGSDAKLQGQATITIPSKL